MQSQDDDRKDERVAIDFGDAIRALKAGQRVCRAGWNGKGMWVMLVQGNLIPAPEGWMAMMPCLSIKTAQGTMQPGWLASQADMLAEDWEIVT